jgi:RNA polymerase sigma factor (sigma-70 family)
MNYTEDDCNLIEKIQKNNDSGALLELEARHSGICHQMIKKYYNTILSVGLNPEEITSDKLLIIYKSAINFDFNKNVKFSTWLGNQMRYHCLNCINKKTINTISLEHDNIKYRVESIQSSKPEFSILKENSDFILNILKKLKDRRLLTIYKLRYFSDKKMSWNVIAKKLNLSTQTVINLHNKTLKILKNKLTSINNLDII